VNLDFALVTDIRLMPETFVAYDVGITSHITKSSAESSTNTSISGLFQAEQIALSQAELLLANKAINRFPALQFNGIELA